MLKPRQSEAALDLVQQCRVFIHAHEQLECHRRGGSATLEASRREEVEKELPEALEKAKAELIKLYRKASMLYVPAEILDGILDRNLPSGVTIPDLSKEVAK